MLDCEVVVVGGGISGLTAAYALRDRDVRLLEATDRVGGRLKSVRHGDYWLNLGGHLLGSETSPMGRLATELGVPLTTSRGSVTAVAMGGSVLRSSHPNLMPFRLPMSAPARWSFIRTGLRLKAAYREALRWDRSGLTGVSDELSAYPTSPRLDEQTYADVLGPMHATVAALMRVTANRLATEPERLAAHIGTVDTVGVWALKRPNVVGGTEEVPRALRALLGDRVRTGAVVERVEQNADHVTVHAREGSEALTVRARACVVATPAPVVRQIVSGLPDDKDAALGRVSYGPFLVLGIFTGESDPMPWDGIYAMAVPGRTFCMFFNPSSVLHAEPGQPRRPGGALVVYAAGDRAAELMGGSDEAITAAYLKDLGEIYPRLPSLVTEVIVQRWPLGVPVTAPGRAKIQPAIAAPVGRIAFAGDYVVHPGMDSAISSAMAAERHVRRTLQGT
jgi:oxygen-dependent protoporphyrinogen oxidase